MHIIFDTAVMYWYLWNIGDDMILYDRQYPESDALSLVRKIFWYWIGILGGVLLLGLVWTEIIKKSGK